ncbi:G-type lectin S-receptor-like serine/threonine-protein kinase LECRK3 [Rosa rugosa]|uniref:G-type lectin S-receptor-like serine/threonine-protein kinase LECRK3 n=1 Tax=Rosa rugosa TaxID=74645 RepID=UPI002B404A26|nr:G-type lectin S-receptor-like serine/threonine-protein kinase LECRK3 [Rosa rugosa]
MLRNIMASTAIAILLFSLYSLCEGAQQINDSSHIRLGSSLFPETHPSSWPSASGQFEFGFYQQGSGFAVGIWLVGVDQNTTVWTANRDDPPLLPSPNNIVKLQLATDGKLVLTSDQSHKKVVIANATYGSVSSASMLDSGNFVLYDEIYKVIWESFNHPTDTILGGQTLPTGGQLVSSLSDADHSTRRFHLNMQTDGNLVLYPENSENSPIDAYYSTGTDGNLNLDLYLNSTDGGLALINTTSSEVYSVINRRSGNNDLAYNNAVYRATVGVNGVLRVYSHQIFFESLQAPVIMWNQPNDPCNVNGVCGLDSYCTLNDGQLDCVCLPGSDYADLNRRTMGCLRNYSEPACAAGGKQNTTFYDILTMKNMAWVDAPYFEATMTMEECKRSCLEDCNCGAALFEQTLCKKQKPPLRYVKRDLRKSDTDRAFLKVSTLTTSPESKNNGTETKEPTTVVIRSKKVIVQILVLTLGLILFSCVALAISGFYIFKIRVLRYKRLTEINGNLGLADEELTMRVFSYNELKRATNGFKQELGKGSFGAVYKGALNRGKKLIAVKRLEKLVEEGEREFRAEMQAIGRTHHKNLVRLLGYSAEDSKRLLVYEYMSNGSLADLLFKKEWHPAWDERVRIAVDVARGLLYLHEECNSPVIHCDIKPQNILMDEFWNAKISDFGLAKLLMPDQTRTFTGIRGTRGYLAPEWQKNTPISVKADIYSFGIVLLELMCCRRNLDVRVREDEIVLSTWVYKCFVSRELHKLIVGGEEVNKKSLENMVKVGLWCIQDEPALRPSMKSVVLMLQGITDISIPPCPTTASM